MAHSHRFLFVGIISLLFLTTSCKQTNKVCLLDTIENISGAKSTYEFDDQDRPIRINSYDANGSFIMFYQIYYHSNGKIDHIDVVTGYNVIVERYQSVFNFNDQIGTVYYLYDQFGINNPTTIGGYANFKYDTSGELDSCIRYNESNVLTQAYDVTYTNGNIVYAKEVLTDTESYFTYDNHGGGRTDLHEFFKILMPYMPLASVNNCLTRQVYVSGVLTTSESYPITYNSDGLAETIDDDDFIFNCTDREQ